VTSGKVLINCPESISFRLWNLRCPTGISGLDCKSTWGCPGQRDIWHVELQFNAFPPNGSFERHGHPYLKIFFSLAPKKTGMGPISLCGFIVGNTSSSLQIPVNLHVWKTSCSSGDRVIWSSNLDGKNPWLTIFAPSPSSWNNFELNHPKPNFKHQL